MAVAVHHVNLCTPPGASGAVAAFYRDVFGFAPLDRPDTGRVGAWLGAGGAELHLSERHGDAHPDQHVAFLVDDIAAVRTAAEERGAVVRAESDQRFFLRDPAGNLVEVLGTPDAAQT
ncbi:MAG: VOC family protein [Acidimicrobiia bacterium]|nr:VOC family protein [Acidimicrobiia bacterium]